MPITAEPVDGSPPSILIPRQKHDLGEGANRGAEVNVSTVKWLKHDHEPDAPVRENKLLPNKIKNSAPA